MIRGFGLCVDDNNIFLLFVNFWIFGFQNLNLANKVDGDARTSYRMAVVSGAALIPQWRRCAAMRLRGYAGRTRQIYQTVFS